MLIELLNDTAEPVDATDLNGMLEDQDKPIDFVGNQALKVHFEGIKEIDSTHKEGHEVMILYGILMTK